MPKYTVKVKWGKETYPDVEVDTDESPLLFKAQLFALTGVQPDRQKVVLKGVTLKDTDWGNIKLKDGVMMLMMGTKEELPSEPVQKTVFMEDMNESELATALDLPAGLTNLGNTCYMNATIQCLRTVPELRDALKKYTGDPSVEGGAMAAQSITSGIRDLFVTMDLGNPVVPPIFLVQALHAAFPWFAEKSEHGGYRQQDASECWTEIVRMLQQKLPPVKEGADKNSYKSIMDQYFGGKFDVEYKCIESEDEPVTKATEDFLQLSCFISQEVKYMHSGLKNKMQEQITKMSPTLSRDAVYAKTCKIKRLPAYLTVQFVRFYYKEKGSINAKILKDVKFPLDFDAFDLCTPELQEKLTPMRNKFKEIEDANVENATKGKEIVKKDDKKKGKVHPFSFDDDLGSNNSGYYTLQAVLTHRGRSSSSGHYVGWVRKSPGSDVWMKCDDDVVTPITTEEILKLSGGGDWHCAYVLLYGPRVLETPIEDTKMETDSSTS